MEISYLGHSCFKIEGNSASIVTDPFKPEMVGLKLSKLSSDLVTVSHDHEDHNYLAAVSEYKKVIHGPGEYEVSGISVIGVRTYHDNKKGQKRGENTIYVLEVDEVRLLHLGDLGHKLSEKTLGELGAIDVLLIPVGGFYTLGPQEATEVVRSIEPIITIPMHYQTKGLKKEIFAKLEPVDQFLKDLDLPVEKTSKFKVKKDDLGEDQKIVVLETN